MSTSEPETPVEAPPPAEVGEATAPRGGRLSAWIGGAFSLALLIVILWQAYSFDLSAMQRLIPASPMFWIMFIIAYLVGPIADYAIFHRVWDMPRSGLIALLRKQVSNELLLGYLGELYFYVWSRRHVKEAGGTFGAVKDAAILSGVVGNVITLILLAVTAPLLFPVLKDLSLSISPTGIIASIAVILLTSLAVLLFRRHLFSLPRRDLIYIVAIYTLRTFVAMGAAAWMWHIALPAIAFGLWLLLATIRQLLARLPLMPNKDVAFAGVSILLVGRNNDVGALMTMIAGLILGAHLIVGAILVVEAAIMRGLRRA